MDTAQEALFKSMLQSGWFTRSDGDVESPTGYFGYMLNDARDFLEIAREFADIISSYGDVNVNEEFTGNWFAYMDGNGIIHITKVNTPVEAKDLFDKAMAAYAKWNAQGDS